jgi:hypothetical protein
MSEPVFVDHLRSPVIDSQPGGPVRQPYFSYRPAEPHRLTESIPGLHKQLQIRVQGTYLGWLVRLAPRAGTRDFCPAMAARRPSTKYFFLTTHYFGVLNLPPIAHRTRQAVVPCRLSLKNSRLKMELGMAGGENSTPKCKHCITIPATASAFDDHRYPTKDVSKA